MNQSFTFNPMDVIWFDQLPARPEPKTAVGRMKLFVEVLKTRPGTYGKYPHIYKGGAGSSLFSIRQKYPEIQWEARGDSLYGRFPG